MNDYKYEITRRLVNNALCDVLSVLLRDVGPPLCEHDETALNLAVDRLKTAHLNLQMWSADEREVRDERLEP